MLLTGACRNFHVMVKSARLSVANEEPVPLFEAEDYEQIKALGDDNDFTANMLGSQSRSKMFSLIPFFMESRFTTKHLVSKASLYPQAELIGFEVLTMDGLKTQYMPINHLIPITKYDYWAASWRYWTKQNTILDLDMIYACRNSKDMYVFEKKGKWHDAGVQHEALSMEKTYNEAHWYDGFYVNTM